jgi:hypothetical protein
LTSAGIAILLFLPLYWIQHRSYVAVQRVADQQGKSASRVATLDKEIQEVQEQITATNLRLDEIGVATQKRITEQRTDDDNLVNSFLAEPSWDNAAAMLDSARKLRAIQPSVVCRIGSSNRWVAFLSRTVGEPHTLKRALQIFLDDSAESVRWIEDEQGDVAMARVADGLKQVNAYPGDDQFDASTILETLGRTIGMAFTLRHDGSNIGRIAAIANHDWLLTDRGLESRHEEAGVTIEEIKRGHAVGPEWVYYAATPERQQAYEDALQLAERLFSEPD